MHILIKEETILQKVKAIGQKINGDYQNKNPVIIGVLKGSFMFLSDLLKEIKIPVEVDFVSVSSYDGKESSGEVKLVQDISSDITDRDIIVVEDVVDTGCTLRFLLDRFSELKPRSVAVCSLLNKRNDRQIDIHITYLGFNIPSVFVVGYGLDQSNKYRNLNFIGVVNGK
ncbi:MAG: hypoxanthine phosphoribosyltransferase [bacterium]